MTSSPHKPNDMATRRFIRSHVMRGKNSRADRRKRKPADDGDETHEWVLTAPRKVASEMALFQLGVELRPYMQELVYRGNA